MDCLDKSDEIDCKKIIFGPDYSRIIPRSKKGNVPILYKHPVIFIAIDEKIQFSVLNSVERQVKNFEDC